MSEEFDKLLEEINNAIRATPHSNGEITKREAAEAWGVSLDTAYRKLSAAVDSGLLEPCWAKKKTRFGIIRSVQCYRPIPTNKPKKKR